MGSGDYLPESSGSDKDFNLSIKKKTNQQLLVSCVTIAALR